MALSISDEDARDLELQREMQAKNMEDATGAGLYMTAAWRLAATRHVFPPRMIAFQARLEF